MDEMTLVRELRAEVPAPDRRTLEAGRQRLLERAGRRGGGVWRVHVDRRLVVLAAVAAVVATAVVGTQAITDGQQSGPANRPPSYVLQLGDAKVLLQDTADVVARGVTPHPRADQWVYTKEAENNLTDQERPGLRERESWDRYADTSLENGKAGDDHSRREMFQFLADLPNDATEVKKRARTFYPDKDNAETEPQHDFRALSILAMSRPVHPQGLAAVYRAMATVPGVKAAQVTDAAGRDAIALYLPADGRGSLGSEFLIDPRTGLYSGSRSVALKDNQDPDVGPSDHYKKGDVVIDHVILKTALVDEEGDTRPSRNG